MGVDIGGGVGAPIYAAADGAVMEINLVGAHGYGRHVIIEHGGGAFRTLYAHLHKVNATIGQTVLGGDKIGEMGGQPGDDDPIDGASSGSHLHFEVILQNKPDGDSIKTWAGWTVDPLPYLTRLEYGDPRLTAKVIAARGVRMRSEADANSTLIGALSSKSVWPIIRILDIEDDQWAQLWSLRPEFAAVRYQGEKLMEVSAGGTATVPAPSTTPPVDEGAIRLDEINRMIALLEHRKSEL
jgi:hypothetical protein